MSPAARICLRLSLAICSVYCLDVHWIKRLLRDALRGLHAGRESMSIAAEFVNDNASA